MVLIDHSFPLTGSQERAVYGRTELGTWAVAGFFCLSGYLIAGSRTRTGALAFLWRRVIRIFPALLVVLVVTVSVFAPIATATGHGSFTFNDAVAYVAKNITLYFMQWSIGTTLAAAPYPDAWNGSLWTLFYEFSAYITIGVILSSRFARRHAAAVLGALFVVAMVGTPWVDMNSHTNLYKHATALGTYFLAGSLLWSLRDRVPLDSRPLGYAALRLTALIGYLQPINTAWAALPLAYSLLWLGNELPIAWFSHTDISYGMYVYAFPLQQLLTLLTGNLNPFLLMTLAWPIVAVFAFVSWRLVEEPALRLKRLVR